MKRVIFDIAALIARVAIGVIFVAHGLQKWTMGLGATSAGFAEMGVPLPQAAAAFATIIEVVCGVLLILGLAVRVAAALLLIDMIGAVVFVHAGNGVFVQDSGWEFAVALAAGCLLLLALGGGRFGLDGIINAIYKRRARKAAAGSAYGAEPGPYDRTQPMAGEEDTRPIPTDRNTTPTATDRDGQPMAGDRDSRPIAGDQDGRPMAGDQGGRPVAGDQDGRSVAGDRDAPASGQERRASGLSDRDMSDVDRLLRDDPAHPRPRNR